MLWRWQKLRQAAGQERESRTLKTKVRDSLMIPHKVNESRTRKDYTQGHGKLDTSGFQSSHCDGENDRLPELPTNNMFDQDWWQPTALQVQNTPLFHLQSLSTESAKAAFPTVAKSPILLSLFCVNIYPFNSSALPRPMFSLATPALFFNCSF